MAAAAGGGAVGKEGAEGWALAGATDWARAADWEVWAATAADWEAWAATAAALAGRAKAATAATASAGAVELEGPAEPSQFRQ